MTNDEIVITGYVLRNVPYQENDGIITVLTENQIYTFKARGIMKFSSKNASSCLLYSKSEFILGKKGEYYFLIKGKLITSHYSLYESIEKMCLIGIVSESILMYLSNCNYKELYDNYEAFFKGIDEGFSCYTLSVILMAYIIKEAGYGLEVDKCIKCGNTEKIVSLNFEEGGFICQKCLNSTESILSTEYLKTMRYIFKVTRKDYTHYELNQKLVIGILHQLIDYIQKNLGYKKIIFYDLFKQSFH